MEAYDWSLQWWQDDRKTACLGPCHPIWLISKDTHGKQCPIVNAQSFWKARPCPTEKSLSVCVTTVWSKSLNRRSLCIIYAVNESVSFHGWNKSSVAPKASRQAKHMQMNCVSTWHLPDPFSIPDLADRLNFITWALTSWKEWLGIKQSCRSTAWLLLIGLSPRKLRQAKQRWYDYLPWISCLWSICFLTIAYSILFMSLTHYS